MKLTTPAVVFVNFRPKTSSDLDDSKSKNVELFKGYRMVSIIITLKYFIKVKLIKMSTAEGNSASIFTPDQVKSFRRYLRSDYTNQVNNQLKCASDDALRLLADVLSSPEIFPNLMTSPVTISRHHSSYLHCLQPK